MADIADVADTLAAIMASVVYPNGTAEPSAVGHPVRVYPGWPNRETLDADLRAGVAHATCFPMQQENSSIRYLYEWRELSRQTAAVTATVADRTVTLAGSIQAGDIVTVIVGGVAVSTAAQVDSTLATLASSIATLLVTKIEGTSSSGAVVTVGGTEPVTARVGVQGVQVREVRRSAKMFMLTVWANSNEQRADVSRALDAALSAINRVAFPDTTKGRVWHAWSLDNDNPQEALLYRRDIVYWVEFPVTQMRPATEITSTQLGIVAEDAPPLAVVQ